MQPTITSTDRTSPRISTLAVFFLLLALALQSCAPAAQSAGTDTLTPTRTLRPSRTATATNTFTLTATPTTTITTTPTETPIPSPTPIPSATFLPSAPPIRTDGWTNTVVETLCISAEQSGVEGVPPLPILETARDILPRLGLRVADEGQDCQAHLRFHADLTAWSSTYSGAGTCYSGAEVIMTTVLSIPGEMDLQVEGLSWLLPPQSIEGCPSEQQAPFAQVWYGSMFAALGQIWGDALIARLWDMTGVPVEIQRGATRLDWVTLPEAEVLPALQAAAASPGKFARLGVIEAIERLAPTSPDAAPYAAILTTLASDPDLEVQFALIDAAAVLGEPYITSIIQILATSAHHADPSVQIKAVEKLGGFYCGTPPVTASGLEPAILETTVDLLASPNPSVQSAAAAAVRSCMWTDAVPAVIQALRAATPETAPFFVQTLEHVTGQQLGADPNAWQAWWDGRSP